MKKISLVIAICLSAFFVWSPFAFAETHGDDQAVSPRLIIDMDAVVPGGHLRVGVCFVVEKGWHIYWTNPGDAGLPTQVEFGGPEGFEFSETKYPAPFYFGAGTPLAGYGYENKAMLFADLLIPEKIEGGQVTISARTKWLACKNKCIPGQATLSATLPVAEQCEEGSDYDLFETCALNVPAKADDIPGLIVSGLLDASAILPDTPFEAVFVLKAPPDKKLAPLADEHVPAFIPVKHDNYEIESLDFPKPGAPFAEEIPVRVKGRSYPDDAPAEKIGGVFQLRLAGNNSKEEIVRFQYEMDLPRAKAGSPVTKIALPAFEIGASGDLAAPVSNPAKSPGLLWMILLGFVGGVILNVMPCVLPVVSIKVMSLIKQSNMDRRSIRAHGLAYTAGILLSFMVLTLVVAVLKSGGEAVGWGFQFQSPLFVSLLAAVVFIFGLSMMGVFEITTPVDRIARMINDDSPVMMELLDEPADTQAETRLRLRLGPSFVNGVFATVLATPCTAPFLGAALGFAFTQPIYVTFAIFFFVGLGLAFPFLILAFIPAWTKFMPRPGDWMVTFKALMGFLLLATVVWLLDVLGKQVGAAGLTRMFIYLTLLGLAAWIYGRFGNIMKIRRTRLIAVGISLFLMVGGGAYLLRFDKAAATQIAHREGGISWERFSEERVMELNAEGRTVFIDFTAAWCWTCKVNEKAVIETDEVRETLKNLNIAALKGDWTNRDKDITAYLKKRGKAGVPLYVIVAPGKADDPAVLPEVITREMLITALKNAAS